MIIKTQGDRLLAFNSYKYKDRLKSIGFRYDPSEKVWWIKSNSKKLLQFSEEFASENLQICSLSSQAIKKAVSDNKAKERYLKSVDDYKKSLFESEQLNISEFEVGDKYTPYRHQKIAMLFFYKSKVGNLYGDCGVGKTAIILWLIKRLYNENKLNKALIVCPKSIMESAWLEDSTKFTPELEVCILNRGSKINRIILTKDFEGHPKYKKQYDKNYSIYVINYEALNAIKDLLPYYGFDLVAFDEVSKLKNHKSAVSKNCVMISKNLPRRYVMSGTPAPNSEKEYFTQMKILDEDIFGSSFYSFTQKWFEPTGFMGFNLVLDPFKEEEFVKKIYSYGLRFKQKDCVDLPDTQDLFLHATMSKKLSKAYTQLQKEKVLEINSREIPVSNPLAEMLMLRQLSGGIHREDEEIVRCSEHKLEVLKEFLDSNPTEQVVIWACFVKSIEDINELLGNKARALYGKTSSEELRHYTTAFKNGEIPYLVCNPKSVAHGHTWTNSRIEIFYELGPSSEEYEQARKRILRIGQTRKCLYYHILSKTEDGKDTIDKIMYELVTKKLKNSTEIMDRFKSL